MIIEFGGLVSESIFARLDCVGKRMMARVARVRQF
jgi:hypothetical protein